MIGAGVPHRLLLGASWLAFPVVAWQGWGVIRRVPRLPAAPSPARGHRTGTGSSLGLLVLGESTAVSVGTGCHDTGLAGQTADRLAVHTGRAVDWFALGRNGLTAARVREELLPCLPPDRFQLVVLALGVNDVLAFRSERRWRRDLIALLRELVSRIGSATVLVSGVPPLGGFPAFPQPLAGVLGLRANVLDAATRTLLADDPAVAYVPFPNRLAPDVFCHDGVHPSGVGYGLWADALAESALVRLARTSHQADSNVRDLGE